MVACIDLFCGAGGLTNGLLSAGVNVVAGVDFEPSCRFPYEFNNRVRFVQEDIAALSSERLGRSFGSASVKILAGCAPCQPFSSVNSNKKLRDPRKAMLGHFVGLIEGVRPDVVISENVPDVLRSPQMQGLIEDLAWLGYHVWADVIDCSLYGLPQKRKRLVLLASKHGRLDLPPPGGKARTVRDAIGHLPPIQAGEFLLSDKYHTAPALSPLNLKRIRESVPGGCVFDLPESLLPGRYVRNPKSRFRSAYCRMSWDLPSPTLTTQFFGYGTGRYGHPDQDRAISLREGALLQGFPEGYEFVSPGESITFKKVGRLIGNSVPPLLGEVIGRAVLGHLG